MKRTTKLRGRPMSFKPNDALDRAIIVFWEKGYCGASLDDLTKAMGINRPSLYSAFGNKHNLYIKAIRRYSETLGSKPPLAFFKELDIENAVSVFFDMTIRCATAANFPRGCLIANVASDDAGEDKQVQAILTEMFSEAEQAFTHHINQASKNKKLPNDIEPARLARLVLSASHSLAIRARIGAGQAELEQISHDFMSMLFKNS